MKDFELLTAAAKTVVEKLQTCGLTVSLAESCTGGLLAKALTDVPGASNVFECGVVAYSEAVKHQVLGVPSDTLAACGVVSPETALAMARGVRALSGADFGIGITGVAGPGPDGDHPEGEIYIALVDQTTDTVFLMEDRTENARTKHRTETALKALRLLDERLDGGSPWPKN